MNPPAPSLLEVSTEINAQGFASCSCVMLGRRVIHSRARPLPKSAANDTGKTSAEVQRERLLRALRKQHGNAVDIKESLTQTADAVRFGLLWRVNAQAPWQTLLPKIERPRL